MEISGYRIRRAENADLAGMKKIWKTCFGDTAAYIDGFFAHLYSGGQAWLAEAPSGEPAAMAMGLELAALKGPDGRQALPCRYLYAVATLPAHRRLGLGAAVSRAVAAELVLPAEAQLYDYYARLGFQSFFYVKEYLLDAECLQSGGRSLLELRPCSPADYGTIREKLLQGRTHLVFTEAALAYQKTLGELFAVGSGCAAVERDGNGLVLVKELLAPEAEIQAALAALAQHFSGNRLLIRTPADGGANCKPFGQLAGSIAARFPLATGDYPYFGLAFD